MEKKGALLHHWWECKLVQPLWKTVWRFLKRKVMTNLDSILKSRDNISLTNVHLVKGMVLNCGVGEDF